MKSVTFALLALAALSAPVRAESSAERDACTPDVMRLCASEIPNVGAITACLRQRRTSLSTACRTVMGEPEGPVRTVATRR